MGPDEKYNTMLQSLPDRLVCMVGDKVDHTVPFAQRYQNAKLLIIERLKKENPDNLDLFDNLKKRDDISFTDYLWHIKRLAQSEGLGDNQIGKKFRSGFSEQQIPNVEILMNQQQTLEEVAEVMDNISKRQNCKIIHKNLSNLETL